jgi:hypothetical protein
MWPSLTIVTLILTAPRSTPTVDAAQETEASSTVRLAAGAEVDGGAFAGLATASVKPLATLEVADAFSLTISPRFRFQLAQAGVVFRQEDWRPVSNFGQVLEVLRVGDERAPATLRAGNLGTSTLGFGHLLSRYSNRGNALLTPAAARLEVSLGPTRSTVFASDVLGLSVFAGQVEVDVGALASSDTAWHHRLHLTPSVLVDARNACTQGCDASAVRLGYLDASAWVLKTSSVATTLVAGFGGRASDRLDGGFHLGAAADLFLTQDTLSARAEFRRGGGTFRHGFVGPSYEVARFSDLGLGLTPLAQVVTPSSSGAFFELSGDFRRAVTASAAVETFSFGRVDFDVEASARIFEERLALSFRSTVVGLGQTPRVGLMTTARWRLAPGFYLLAQGGTQFFGTQGQPLRREVLASLGVGFDVEKR